MLYTGGAHGADSEWINFAKAHNHNIKIYRYDGVNHTVIEEYTNGVSGTSANEETTRTHRIQETDEFIKRSNEKIQRAAEHLKTFAPIDSHSRHLLYRDVHLIEEPDLLYAVGVFEKKRRLKIGGHTGWITEMFVDKILSCEAELTVYFLNQETGKWYQLKHTNGEFEWEHIKKPPVPTGKYIGVGTRDLSMSGKLEITYL
jgi:hypothetical protein